MFISLAFGESFFPLTPNDMVSILSQALLIHLVGQSLLAFAMGYIAANHGAIILLLSPVVAAIAGVVVYGEDLSLTKVVGMGVILVSILLVKEKRKVFPLKKSQA